MSPRTLDVPELSTIRPDEDLRAYRRRVRPAKHRARALRVVLHVLHVYR